jgi:hypothetical protein
MELFFNNVNTSKKNNLLLQIKQPQKKYQRQPITKSLKWSIILLVKVNFRTGKNKRLMLSLKPVITSTSFPPKQAVYGIPIRSISFEYRNMQSAAGLRMYSVSLSLKFLKGEKRRRRKRRGRGRVKGRG